MGSLKVHDTEVGDEYIDALDKVLLVRIDRRKQYGDSYLEDEDHFLLAQIENKIKRFKLQFDGLKLSHDEFKMRTAKDSLIDMINYALFELAKIEQYEQQEKKKLS